MSPQRDLVTFLGLAEPLSSLLHFAMALVFAGFGALLLRRLRGQGLVHAAVLGYLVAVGGMFFVSAVYHSLPGGNAARDLFWHLDHAAIWTGLAATFSAVRVVFCEGRLVRPLIALWLVAALGVTTELTALRDLPLWVSPLLYILMGWCGLPTVLLAGRMRGRAEAPWMLAAGVLVTIGGFMDASSWPPAPVHGMVEAHELLHVTTVVGGAVYFHRIATGALRHATAGVPAARETVESAAQV